MSSLGRASVLLGAGTLVSRITGLLRTIVLVGVIGSVGAEAADAFAVANQLPNSVFSLISVGILTAVIVPQIVKASRSDDGGSAFISKLFTLGTVVLVATTALATALAPVLVMLSAKGTPAQLALATAFAYWCLPQILFYGLYALLGETLNARRIFGPFSWAPVINNIVSIIGFLILGAVFGGTLTDTGDWNAEKIAALGGTATLGIALQAFVLVFFWKRTGIRLRFDFRWRGVGMGSLGKAAGWTFLMAIASLVAGTFQGWLVFQAAGEGASVATMSYAWLIFMLPYSVIVHSIGTPYFTQLSEHASEGKDAEVRADISRCIRTLGFFLMAALAAIVAAAVPASRVFTQSPQNAEAAAVVLLCYLAGLLSLAVLFIVQRTFYAYGDTRTPFWFTIFQCVLIVGSAAGANALVAAGILPITALAAAVALGQSVAGTVQTIVACVLLHRRLSGIHTAEWMHALLRFAIAAVPAGFAGWGVWMLMGGASGWTTADKLQGALGTAIIGGATVVIYLAVLAVLRAPELAVAKSIARRFLPGR